jgi:pimeloyl-ACP methyl ester carboxylesterase
LIYKPEFESRSRFLPIRGLDYHVREWGDADLPKLIMVHGWMDVSASFQFIADQLADRFHIFAPDWRGYGLTKWPAADTYWFADYLADMDFLLDALVGDAAIPIIGHSMGGNVVMLYGGVRPERASHVINLEGFGLGGSQPEQAPRRYAKWMDALKDPPALRPYANVQDVAARLMKNNPRMTADKAAFLAPHWAGPVTYPLPPGEGQGEGVAAKGKGLLIDENALTPTLSREERAHKDMLWRIRGDPAHRLPSPQLYRVEEVLACWRAITAPVLWVEALQTDSRAMLGGIPDFEERLTQVRHLTTRKIDNAGHMLHHDQPEEVARVIAEFLLP